MRDSDRSILVRTVLLIIPVFFVWQLLLSYVVLPVITEATDYSIKILYSELKPRLFFQEKTQTWELKTALFLADFPYGNNTYKPNFSITGPTVLVIGKLEALTLGLPLFWLLFFLGSTRKLKQFLQGSVILIAIICLNLTLLVAHNIISYLQSSALIRIYDEPYILKPPSLPVWFVDLIKPLLDTLVYMSILVVPVWLAYHYYSIQNDIKAECNTALEAQSEENFGSEMTIPPNNEKPIN